MEHQVRSRDGRRLQVSEAGVPEGAAVLVHMGMPNSRLLYEPWQRVAERQAIRLISYDRPGYGGSDPDPGRSVASGAHDVRTIAQTLGIERLAVWGISGGGPYALACAALLSDLVAAVAVFCSSGPWGDEEANADDAESEGVERAEAEQARADWLAATPATVATMFDEQGVLSAADRAALTPAMAEYLCALAQQGLAPGADGWFDDWVALDTPWGFEIEQIRVPVLVLHGRQDWVVPFANGEWLAAHVPSAQAWLTDHDGHLTLADRVEDVHDWLLERMP